MSARNYLSAREKNFGKLTDCFPSINQQKFGYRSAQDLPPLSANTSKLLNRNLNYSYDINSYLTSLPPGFTRKRWRDDLDVFEPDWPVEAMDRKMWRDKGETFAQQWDNIGTPDFHSEESDSSSGSVLRRSTAEATKTLSEEWNRIERTLYNEDGEKSTRPNILEECKQWRQLHPQLRVVGKAIQLPEKRSCFRQIEHDEVIAMHYNDFEEFSESEERLSQSSTDVTPQNSPRPSVASIPEDLHEPRLSREKVSFYPTHSDEELPDSFCSLLQITPIQIRSPSHRKKQSSSILRSEIASSKWMRNSRPDSSLNCDRNSAKSFVSLDTRNYMALSASERNTILNSRVVTARHRELARLEPLCSPEMPQESPKSMNGSQQYHIRKVSLPPLLLEEEKRKVASAKKHNTKSRKRSQPFYQFDRVRH